MISKINAFLLKKSPLFNLGLAIVGTKLFSLVCLLFWYIPGPTLLFALTSSLFYLVNDKIKFIDFKYFSTLEKVTLVSLLVFMNLVLTFLVYFLISGPNAHN